MVKASQFRAQLVDRIADWLNAPVVVEFSAGLVRVSGLWVLVGASEAELQFALDDASHPQCDFSIHLDEVIASMSFSGFEEAAAKILGKRREHLEPEEQSLFSAKAIEQVADIRFRTGGRLLLGLVRHDWDSTPISHA